MTAEKYIAEIGSWSRSLDTIHDVAAHLARNLLLPLLLLLLRHPASRLHRQQRLVFKPAIRPLDLPIPFLMVMNLVVLVGVRRRESLW